MIGNNYFKILILLSFFKNISSNTFVDLWYKAQKIYKALDSKHCNFDKSFFTSHYLFLKGHVKYIILNSPNADFLNDTYIKGTMVRTEYGQAQKFEECYLENCISLRNRKIIEGYKDCDLLKKECNKNTCSINTLGHLFYAGKLLENCKREPNIIVEFGGGYGNLARILNSVFQNSKIVIFDIPEIIALQYLFLLYTVPGLKIHVVDSLKDLNFDAGSVFLIPVYLMNKCNFKADVFISTFALSESPKYVQDILINKNFFDANLIYITGQINGWKTNGYDWIEGHSNILDKLRQDYSTQCVPFHIFSGNEMSYEVIAHN